MAPSHKVTGLLLVLAVTCALGLAQSTGTAQPATSQPTSQPAGRSRWQATSQPARYTTSQPARHATSRPTTFPAPWDPKSSAPSTSSDPAKRAVPSRASLVAAEKVRREATKIVATLATAKASDLAGIEQRLAGLGEVSMVALKLAALSDNFELRRRADRIASRLRWRLVAGTSATKWTASLVDVMSGSDVKARAAMVEKMVTSNDPRLVGVLGECLADWQTFVRQRAIDGLVALGGDRTSRSRSSNSNRTQITRLLEGCLDDDDLNMRLLAVAAMAKLGVASIDRLAEMLDDESIEVQTTAIKAMGLSDKPKAVAHLNPLLKDRRWQIRAAALAALGQLIDEDTAKLAGKQVTELLADDDEFVRGLAAKMVGQWQWQGAAPVVLRLMKEGKLADVDAFGALAAMKSTEGLTLMLKRYDASSDPGYRVNLLEIMDAYDPNKGVDSRITKALVDKAMKSHWPQVFQVAVYRRQSEKHTATITGYLVHADTVVAKGAWRVLDGYGLSDGAPLPEAITAKLLAWPDPTRVKWGLFAEYTYRGKTLPSVLRKALDHADPGVVALALSMIAFECVEDPFGGTLPRYRRDSRRSYDDDVEITSLMPPSRDPAADKPPFRMPADMVAPVSARLSHADVTVSLRAAALLYRSEARSDAPVTDVLRKGLKSKKAPVKLIAMAGITERAKPFLKDFDLVAAARDAKTSGRALEIIAVLGDPAYTPALIELGRKGTYENERLMGLLIRSGDKVAAEVVFEKFKKAESYELTSFIESDLEGMKGPGVVTFVDWALQKADSDDSMEIFQVLLTLPDPSVEDAIRNAMKRAEKTGGDYADRYRTTGMIRLVELDPEGTIPELRKMLLSSSQDAMLESISSTTPTAEMVTLLLDVAQVKDRKVSPGWASIVPWLGEKAFREKFMPAMSSMDWYIQQQLMGRLAGSLSEKDLELLLASSVTNTFMQEYLSAMTGVVTAGASSRRPDLSKLAPGALVNILNAAGDWDNGAQAVMPYVNDPRPPVATAARRALAYYALGRREAPLGPASRDALLATVKSGDGIGAYLAAEALAQRWKTDFAALTLADVPSTAAVTRLAVAQGANLSDAMRKRLAAVIAKQGGATGRNLALIAAGQAYHKSLNIDMRDLEDEMHPGLLLRIAAAAKDERMVRDLLSYRPEMIMAYEPGLKPIVMGLIAKGRADDNSLFRQLVHDRWIDWAGPTPQDLYRVLELGSLASSSRYYDRGVPSSDVALNYALSWAAPAGQVDPKVVAQISPKQSSGVLAGAVAAVRWNMPQGRKALLAAAIADPASKSARVLERRVMAIDALSMCITPQDAKAMLASITIDQKQVDDEDDEDEPSSSEAREAKSRLARRAAQLATAAAPAAPHEVLDLVTRLAGTETMQYRYDDSSISMGALNAYIADDPPRKAAPPDQGGDDLRDVMAAFRRSRSGREQSLIAFALAAARAWTPQKDPEKVTISPADIAARLMPPWGSHSWDDEDDMTWLVADKDEAALRLARTVKRIRAIVAVKGDPDAAQTLRENRLLAEYYDPSDLRSMSPEMRREILAQLRDYDDDEEESESMSDDAIPLTLPAGEIVKALRPLLAGKETGRHVAALEAVRKWHVADLAPEVERCVASADPKEALAAARTLGQLRGAKGVDAVAAAYRRQKDFLWRVRFACVLRQLGSEIGRADIDRAIALRTTRLFRLKFVSKATEAAESGRYRRSRYRSSYGGGGRIGWGGEWSCGQDTTINEQMLPWLDDLESGAADLLAVEDGRFPLPPSGMFPGLSLLSPGIGGGGGRYAPRGGRVARRLPQTPQCDLSVLTIYSTVLSPAKLVTMELPLTSLVGQGGERGDSSLFASLCATEQDLEPFFHVQFADQSANLADLHRRWLAWWAANKDKSRQDWWRQALGQAVEELTHKRWWHRMRAVRRLARLTGRSVKPVGVFDTKAWAALQKTWRTELAQRADVTSRQWLLTAAVAAGALKPGAAATAGDDAAYLDALVRITGWAPGPLAEAACLRLETWPDEKQLVRHALAWQACPRSSLRSWVKERARTLTGKHRMLYTAGDLASEN